MTVIGTGVLKVFKLAEQALKPMPLNANRRDTLSFTCQAWVPLSDKGADGPGTGSSSDGSKGAAGGSSGDRERQLLGTVDGEVLLFEVSCQMVSWHCSDVIWRLVQGDLSVCIVSWVAPGTYDRCFTSWHLVPDSLRPSSP